jgi:hypothetical protein
MFPYDTITLYRELAGPGSYVLVNNTDDKTILGVSVQQSATNSTSDVRCGSSDIFVRNYGKDFPYNQMSKQCTETITVEKTGNDSASFIVSYIPRYLTNYSSIETQVEIATGSATALSNNIKVNYIFMGLVLFCLGFIIAMKAFKR